MLLVARAAVFEKFLSRLSLTGLFFVSLGSLKFDCLGLAPCAEAELTFEVLARDLLSK